MNHRKIVVFVTALLCILLLFTSCSNTPTETLQNTLTPTLVPTETPTVNPTPEPTPIPDPRTVIDIVSYIEPYLTWYGGTGNIRVATDNNIVLGTFGELGTILFQIDDLYFHAGKNAIGIVKGNTKIGYIEFHCVDLAESPGDQLEIIPTFHTSNNINSNILDSYEFIRKTVTAPYIGDYLTKDSPITNEMIASFESLTYFDHRYVGSDYQYVNGNPDGHKIDALYALDLNAGYTHIAYGGPEQSDRMFIVCLKDLERQRYSVFMLVDVTVNNNVIVASDCQRIYSDEWSLKYFSNYDNIILKIEEEFEPNYTYTKIY